MVAVTIHRVAREAGVSVSTVSRAFGAPEVVNEETRRRVLAVAAKLHYQPNRAARGLITGRTGNIGVIVPDLENPFFHCVLKGVQSRAWEADNWVFLADSREDPQVEYELITKMSKQVDGIVVCSSRMTTAQLEQVAADATLVFLNRKVHGSPSVFLDSARDSRQVIDHLAHLGHRRLAYLSGPTSSWSNRERRRGLRYAAKKHGLEIVELGPYAPHFESGRQGTDVALGHDVTAIVAFNDLMALGVLARLAECQIPVPTGCSVVGFDDIPMASMTSPPLTTLAVPKEEAGRAAGEMLLGLLADAGDKISEVGLSASLAVRASTAPPKPAAAPTHATASHTKAASQTKPTRPRSRPKVDRER